MNLPSPYALFLGDADPLSAKTAAGIAHWRPERCVAQITLPACTADLKLPTLSPKDAAAAGARLLIVGIADFGGAIAPRWIPTLMESLREGLDLAAGLHHRLADIPELAHAAQKLGRRLIDVRQPRPEQTPFATGGKRTGKRLLSVGTDCAVGKMFASLAIERELRTRGHAATFRATGQTGIFIAGSGVSVDAVVSDFVAGAAEALSPANAPNHWDLIEGQGSLHHPAYATPSFEVAIADNERAARLTNPDARVVGISVNTSTASEEAALGYLRSVERRLGLPCCDPVRTGVGAIVDRLLRIA